MVHMNRDKNTSESHITEHFFVGLILFVMLTREAPPWTFR